MTTAFLMGIVSLSLYWTFAVPLYVAASPLGAGLSLVIGLFFLLVAAAQTPIETFRPARGVAMLVVVSLAAALVGFPMPYKVGPLLAFAGILGWLAYSEHHPRLRPVWYALALGGFVLIAESVVIPLYQRIVSAEHNLPWLRTILGGLLWMVGLDPTVGEDSVFVPTMRALHGFPVTTERLGLFTATTILVGFFVAVACLPSLRRSALRLIPLGIVAAVVYALVRYAAVITAYIYLMHRMGYEDTANRVDIFWNPWWTAITFFPLAWCFAALAPKPERPGSPDPSDWLESVLGAGAGLRPAVLCALLAAAGIVAAVALPEPSQRKSGRVLVDEYHSNWEKTTRPFDTAWYGQESGYNYYCIYDYLSRFYRMGRLETPITPDALHPCDVLVVKIPTRAYDDSEVKAIVNFVRQGGGLFLIGEHTNVFGSGVYINRLARPFGFEFRFDCLFDTARKFEQVYRPPKMLPHPIVMNLPLFFFQVSCSIKLLGFRGEPVIVGTSLKALSVDYHSPNFYPQVIDRSDMDFGPFVEMWTRNVGAGRVLAFGDSTCFSNFCAFQPGKPELLLASIEWLNHRSLWGRWKTVWAAVGLAALVAAIALIVRADRPVGVASVVILVAAGIVPALAFGARRFNRETCAPPLNHAPLLRVGFERQHCDYDLPIEGFVTQPTRSFDMFYQWVLRVGCFPFVAPSLDECARGADAVVLIRPNREFSQREIEWVTRFVTAGGGLLVVDSPSGSAVQPLLQAFDVTVVREGQPYRGMVYGPGGTTFTVESAWPIRGGEPLAWGASSETLAAAASYGHGTVVVASFAERFSDQDMGAIWGVKPTAELLSVYQLEYAMLRAALAGRAASAPIPPPAAPETERATTATLTTVAPTTSTATGDRPATSTRPSDIPTSR